jgi:ribosome-binding protein aMBF1 (putative translation factor)
MAKKPTRKTLIRDCDKLWTEVIKREAGGLCEICGAAGRNSHHIEGRKHSVRWVIENGIYLCIKCHTFGKVSAHSTSYSGQKEFHEKLIGVKGEHILKQIAKQANIIAQFKNHELEKLRSNLRIRLKHLGEI